MALHFSADLVTVTWVSPALQAHELADLTEGIKRSITWLRLLLLGYTSTSWCSAFSLGSLTAGQCTTKAQPADTTLSLLVDNNKMMP